MKVRLVMAVAMVVIAGPAAAQASDKSTVPQELETVIACRSQTNELARLSCYDSAVAALARASLLKELVVLNREDVKRTRRSLFGFSLPNLNIFGRGEADENPDEITAALTSARSIGYGKWQLRLKDGAVWQTTEAYSGPPPRPGDQVVIKRGALGNYFIKIGGVRTIRAKRES